MDVNSPEAWVAAPALIAAGLVLVLARKPLGDSFARQHGNLRRRFPFLSGPDEPIWLRLMLPVVGILWLTAGLVTFGLLMLG